MGNSSGYKQRRVTIPSLPGQWVPCGKTDYCDLVRNTRTGITAEQYHIPIQTRLSKEKNQQIYEERKNQTDNLVAVYHIEKETNQYLCQGKQFLTVKVQRIPYRLSEMNNLPFAESLYILREAVIGYRAITDFYGPIFISDEMIGFTPDHRVKVWLNQQFAHNLPHENPNFFMRQANHIEQKLPNTISQLFSVVEEHCENGQFPEQFGKAYRQYPIQTFSEALQFIQDYATMKGLNLRLSFTPNSRVSAKTDYSLKEKPTFSKISDPISASPSLVQKRQPIRISKQIVEAKRYFPIPDIKVQNKMISTPELSVQKKIAPVPLPVKIQSSKQTLIQSKPPVHFTSSVSKNSNHRIQRGEGLMNFKVLSSRDQLTFTPVMSTKSSAKQNIPKTPTEVKVVQNNYMIPQIQVPINVTKTVPQQVRYSLNEGKLNTPVPFSAFKQLKSPSKIITKDMKVNEKITDNQRNLGLKGKYDKILTTQTGQTRLSYSGTGNNPTETTPKVINFNYAKGQRILAKS